MDGISKMPFIFRSEKPSNRQRSHPTTTIGSSLLQTQHFTTVPLYLPQQDQSYLKIEKEFHTKITEFFAKAAKKKVSVQLCVSLRCALCVKEKF